MMTPKTFKNCCCVNFKARQLKIHARAYKIKGDEDVNASIVHFTLYIYHRANTHQISVDMISISHLKNYIN